MRRIGAGMRWGEGPRYRDGDLWLSDTQGSRLWTGWGPTWRAFDLDSPSNGLWFLPDGRLTGALMRDKRIGVWNGTGWDDYADLSAVALGPLGDMVGDDRGNLYVDDVGFRHFVDEPRPGHILLVRPDGTAETATDAVEFPNGMAFIDGGSTLLVAESLRKRLTAFTVTPSGRLEPAGTWADIRKAVGDEAFPDGIWADGDTVWVATIGASAVAAFRDGQLVESIDTSPRLPIACCVSARGDLIVTLADTSGLSLADAIAQRVVTTEAVVLREAGVGGNDGRPVS
jgi:sugar lactone lactonase YvrE